MTDTSKEAIEGLVESFPEINPSNCDHDDACALNAWGCEAHAALEALLREREEKERIWAELDAATGHHPKGPIVALTDRAEAAEASLSAVRAENAELRTCYENASNDRSVLAKHLSTALAEKKNLREALATLIALNDSHSPFGGEIMRDRIDRAWDNARAALSKQESGSAWQPIETAPRDGTDILVCRDNGCGNEYAVVWWFDMDIRYPWHAQGFAKFASDRWDEWMPLPAPPVEPVKESK